MYRKKLSIKEDTFSSTTDIRASQRKITTSSMEYEVLNLIEEIKKRAKGGANPNEMLLIDSAVFQVIFYVLGKTTRSQYEMTMIKLLLNSFPNFLRMLKGNQMSHDCDQLLTKISFVLKPQFIKENSIVFKTGDKGDNFYIVLKGRVGILVPKDVGIRMSQQDYIKYLLTLRKYNEDDLFNRTVQVNRHVYPVDEYDFDQFLEQLLDTKKTKKISRHMTLSNKQIREVLQHKSTLTSVKINVPCTVDEYITKTTPMITPSDEAQAEVTVWTYHHIITLGPGDTFGEMAFSSNSQKRTATIITIDDCYLGSLTKETYDSCIREAKEKLRKNNISFFLSYPIFSHYGRDTFDKKVYGSFHSFSLKNGEFLFTEGTEGNYIYFIKEGQFDLSTKKTFKEINHILSHLGHAVKDEKENRMKTEYANYLTFANRKHKFRIVIVNNNDLIGLDDYKYEGKYFCSAECVSPRAEIFSLDINYFKIFMRTDETMRDSFGNYLQNKVEIMIERLLNVKKVLTQNFIKAEQRYTPEHEITLPVETNVNKKLMYSQIKKSLMKSNQNNKEEKEPIRPNMRLNTNRFINKLDLAPSKNSKEVDGTIEEKEIISNIVTNEELQRSINVRESITMSSKPINENNTVLLTQAAASNDTPAKLNIVGPSKRNIPQHGGKAVIKTFLFNKKQKEKLKLARSAEKNLDKSSDVTLPVICSDKTITPYKGSTNVSLSYERSKTKSKTIKLQLYENSLIDCFQIDREYEGSPILRDKCLLKNRIQAIGRTRNQLLIKTKILNSSIEGIRLDSELITSFR